MTETLKKCARFAVWPTAFYFVAFCLLTFPEIQLFPTHLFAGPRDGIGNAWNLWWVNRAVTELHQLPWYTNVLHYPDGISLVVHSLSPFNGFVAIPILRFAPLNQALNTMVIFSFVTSGLTAFWLAFYLTHSYRGSLLGGFIFTFSNYHFSHAQGHLNLISTEWIPLFLLLWLQLLAQPRIARGLGAGLALFAVILCDYYYFFYCAAAGAIIFIWDWFSIRERSFPYLRDPDLRAALMVFSVTSLATCGPLLVALIRMSSQMDLLGSHEPAEFSLDLLAPLIPGGHWRFAELTRFYWSRLPGNIHETSVHIGLSLTVALAFLWVKRKESASRSVNLWWLLLFVFGVLSLGPTLWVFGTRVPYLVLPYQILVWLIPPFELIAVPIRMILMVTLSAALLAAMGFQQYFEQERVHRPWIVALMALLLVEYLPAPIPTTTIEIPGYVRALAELPGDDGIIDGVATPQTAIYYQTIHAKPMASGYLARLPRRKIERYRSIQARLVRGEFKAVYRDYGLRYLVYPGSARAEGAGRLPAVVYTDAEVTIYDLADAP